MLRGNICNVSSKGHSPILSYYQAVAFIKAIQCTQSTICREIGFKSKAHNYNNNKFEARLNSKKNKGKLSRNQIAIVCSCDFGFVFVVVRGGSKLGSSYETLAAKQWRTAEVWQGDPDEAGYLQTHA